MSKPLRRPRPGGPIKVKPASRKPAGRMTHEELTVAIDDIGEFITRLFSSSASPKAKARLFGKHAPSYKKLIRARLEMAFAEHGILSGTRMLFPAVLHINLRTGKKTLIVEAGVRTGGEQMDLWADRLFTQMASDKILGE